jgi:PPP family 3-phenylpropionic acid transporter
MYRQVRSVPGLSPTIGAGDGDFGRGLLTAKLFYFFFFAAIGCLVPFLNIYFAQKGLTGAQIGWLGSIAPLIALTANPIWGGVADRWQIHRRVLALCAFGGGAISLLYLVVDTFWPLMIVTIILTFFRTPIGSLVDSAVLDMVRRMGAHYGRQRLWGSLGFVSVTLLFGSFLSFSDLRIPFWIHGILLGGVCVVLAFALPIGARGGQQIALLDGLRRLARRRSYLAFLGAMALLGIGNSSYVNFMGLHMLEVGGNEQMVAYAWAANGLAEVPMMFLGGRWFARFRYSRLLQIGFALYVVVWGGMALAHSPWQVLLAAFGNGICYGFLWVAAVNFAAESAPPGLSATSQALIGAAQSGIGWSIGAVLAGYLFDAAGGSMVYVVAALAALFAGVIFWAGQRGVDEDGAEFAPG